MFRPTRRQISLLESRFLLPPAKRARLDKSWAYIFLTKVLPLIDEELYRDAFDPVTGRPNQSIQLLTGLHLLKEWHDLTDEETLDQLEYNLQWQYALGVTPDEAHLPRKTLHNHRVRTMQDERAQRMLERVTRGLIEVDGLSFARQRMDSTHVISNMAVLTRLGLLVETLTKFIRELKRVEPEKLVSLGSTIHARYLDREGYFADVKKEQARRRLPVVAADLYAVVVAFEQDEAVREWESYKLVVRAFNEQVEVIDKDDNSNDAAGKADGSEATGEAGDSEATGEAGGSDSDAALETTEAAEPCKAGETEDVPVEEPAGTSDDDDVPPDEAKAKVKLKDGKQITGASLQSPHDPDATYGHKGKGYEVQVAETCVPENTYQVITHISVNGAHESDQAATGEVITKLHDRNLGPEEMLGDMGFGSGENIVNAAVNGVDLQAPVQDPNAPKKRDTFIDPSGSTPSNGAPPDGPLGLGDFRFNKTFDQVLACPGGMGPVGQGVDEDRREPYSAHFDGRKCAGCPLQNRCPTRQLKGSEDPVLRWRDAKAATATRQRQQRGRVFKENYKIRSGIESTNAELKGRHGARHLRVRRRQRVEMVMIFKANALNVKRACQAAVRAMIEPPALPAIA